MTSRPSKPAGEETRTRLWCAAPLPFLAADGLSTWRDFFLEIESNTFIHLALVLAALTFLFFYRLIRQQSVMREARSKLPVVIGGWGTRGKSGTERCKAALFHAYGAEVFCKTTGSEAMFIHAAPNQEARELFLFRPLEKVSIWEQMKVVTTARGLNCHVFLYECMAVNPRYASVVQHGWMRDDLTTLTNTYPDHEDMQGPAGFNVAETISSFVPKNSVCWTAEQQMLPILSEAARTRSTELRPVTWLDGAMITDDVLDRMPYREHPNNLAMVVALARHLDIEDDFALKEIADHMIPDLGVLRTYPTVKWKGREARFTNGMSANDRRACLDNWRRLGFFDHNTREKPHEWVIGMVNNRADRVARSKTFAGIIVKDITAHNFFLTGSNLKGMEGYIEAELQANRSIWDLQAEPEAGAVSKKLERDLEHQKFACRQSGELMPMVLQLLVGTGFDEEAALQIVNQDVCMGLTDAAERVEGNEAEREAEAVEAAWLEGSQEFRQYMQQNWPSDALPLEAHEAVAIDDLFDYIRLYWVQMRKASSLRNQVKTALDGDGVTDHLNHVYQEFMMQAVRDRIVVVGDYYASGDQLIKRVLENVPPGHRAHILGMQNIRGTGLDFAYRWVDLLNVDQHIKPLTSPSYERRTSALRWIANHGGYHYFDGLHALDGLKRARAHEINQDERWQDGIQSAATKVREAIAAAEGRLSDDRGESSWYSPFLTILESILDVGDSVLRRLRYERVLEDLVSLRISHQRAATELKDITYRQRGGWLRSSLAKRRKKVDAERNAG